jgi:NAD(P)-dependent dehydrogenase (short-subunit alcohol dehydrogenase family)
MATVLITGASRGIGLEFVRQYASDQWSVIACCRLPDEATELRTVAQAYPRVSVEALDITDHAQINALARQVGDSPIDILINNAGIMGALPLRENLHRQHFGELDYGLWGEIFRTNVFGSVKMTEAFADAVAASTHKKIISLSSTTGSITEGRRPALAYTTSKAALNKAMTVIAEHLRPRGIIVALVCPGYVKTRMNVGGATLEIPESVAGLRTLIAGLTLADSGTFRRYNGESIAW